MKLRTLTIIAGATLLLQACAADSSNDKKMEPTVSHYSDSSKIHVIQPGESLHIISKREYGTISDWVKIYEANRDQIKDPMLVYPGQKIVIPK